MMHHRRALLALCVAVSLLALARPTAAEPQQGDDIIVIANDLADEFNASIAYDPQGSRYTITYQQANNAFRRDLSADGQTLGTAEAFDANGNVGDPFAAVDPAGLSLYPFADRRFDAATDTTAKWRETNTDTFSAQFPVANGSGEQSPACVAAPLTSGQNWYVWFYQRADANAPRQLRVQPLPGGLPLGQPVTLLAVVQNAYIDEAASTTYRETSDGACFVDASAQGHIYQPNITLGDAGFASRLYAYTISAAGVPATSTTLITLTVGALADVAVGTTAGGVHLLYQTDTDGNTGIWLANLPAAFGPVSQTAPVSEANTPLRPSLACLTDGVCLAVWQEFGVGGQDDIWGAFIVAGVPGTPFAVTDTEVGERNPSVAANGTHRQFAVVWEEGNEGGRDVRLRRLTNVPPAPSTPTSTPTVTPTPQATATATPTATPPAPALYLPLALRQ